MPKFEIVFNILVDDIIKRLAGSQIYQQSSENFKKISDQQLAVQSILHKTVFKVDEEGTEAAAVTVIMLAGSSFNSNISKTIILDKPFSFYIVNRKNRAILFSGALMN